MSLIEGPRAASNGLLMPSESDCPFGVIFWAGAANNFGEATIRAKQNLDPSVPVVTVSLEHFFRNVAEPQDWHDSMQRAAVPRFAALRQRLAADLNNVLVYRVGAIRVRAFIIGKAGADIAGLVTTLIET
jgi:Nuclease A inhibitor-like protein